MKSFQEIAKQAVRCDYCFRTLTLGLYRAQIDIAQRRWIGPHYHRANPKVAVIMTNPGAGKGRNKTYRLKSCSNVRNSGVKFPSPTLATTTPRPRLQSRFVESN